MLVNFTATTAMAAGSVTITGGTVPISWTDTGVVTPSGSLPGNPAASGLSVQRWQGQTGDLLDIYDESGDKLFSVTFAKSFGSTPKGVHITAQNAASVGLNHYVSSVSTIGFTVSCGTAPLRLALLARCSSATR